VPSSPTFASNLSNKNRKSPLTTTGSFPSKKKQKQGETKNPKY